MALERSTLARLGRNYLHIRNYEEALHYLGEAVMQGVSAAAADLYHLGQHFYEEKDYAHAEEAFQLLADRGHAEACFMLGEMCQYGRGRRVDIEAAFGYYSESFRQGYALGAYRAGLLMMRDALVSEDIRDIAVSWFEEAIDGGIVEAYGAIGRLYSENEGFNFHDHIHKDDHIALTWYMRGALHGDGASMEMAAICFLNGFGAPRNNRRALELMLQAAEKGRASACMHLGHMYERGIGVYKNWQAAIAWYKRADTLGDHRGRHDAGRAACEAGQQAALFAKDEAGVHRAFTYFDQAIHYGYFPAYTEKAHLAKDKGDSEGYVAALTAGAQNGNDDCRMELVYYYTSQALPLIQKLSSFPETAKSRRGDSWKSYVQTFRQALELYKKAAQAGDADSWAMLAKLYLYRGKDVDISEEDFLEAAKKGKQARTMDTDELLWLYYGPEAPVSPGMLHHEDSKKAFGYARRLAEKGKRKYFPILADYYRNGYGVRRNMTSANHWENKK